MMSKKTIIVLFSATAASSAVKFYEPLFLFFFWALFFAALVINNNIDIMKGLVSSLSSPNTILGFTSRFISRREKKLVIFYTQSIYFYMTNSKDIHDHYMILMSSCAV